MQFTINFQQFNVQRIRDLEYSVLNGIYISRFFPQERDLHRRRDRKILRAKGSGYHQGKSIFQTQQGICTYEFTVIVININKTSLSSTQTESQHEEEKPGMKSHY